MQRLANFASEQPGVTDTHSTHDTHNTHSLMHFPPTDAIPADLEMFPLFHTHSSNIITVRRSPLGGIAAYKHSHTRVTHTRARTHTYTHRPRARWP